MAKGIYFAGKTQGNSKGMKLKLCREPVTVAWHNIHFCLVPFKYRH